MFSLVVGTLCKFLNYSLGGLLVIIINLGMVIKINWAGRRVIKSSPGYAKYVFEEMCKCIFGYAGEE